MIIVVLQCFTFLLGRKISSISGNDFCIERDDLQTMKNIFVCAKHFDSDDIVDTQTYLDIDNQAKTRSIKATLKKGAIPKYLLGCPDRLNDLTIKYRRLDRDKKECDLQIQAIKQRVDVLKKSRENSLSLI
ncbi:hypothetical protein LOD99_1884 [Oopsacas minuta]|uniref:THAP-type domain-containing protein n=1 Tax=Oopsacas minuta TaxID=111878 RepID=A0AAV7K3C3_9METZ|nr:hypothetical protein LOD99_1884 [Oopsacas minuta]